jgi:hypothetical protein
MDQVVGAPKPEDWAYSARKLEIFLDFLSSESISTSPYLLDNKFEGLLDPVRSLWFHALTLCRRSYSYESTFRPSCEMPPRS